MTNSRADWGLLSSAVGILCVALLANNTSHSWATLGNAVLLGFWVGFPLRIPAEPVGEIPFGFP